MKMKITLIGTLLALSISTPSAIAFSFGGFNGASETTQIANNIQLGLQYAEQARIYAKQIDEYKTQLEQFDLEQAMGKLLDQSVLGDTLSILNDFEGIIDIDAAKQEVDQLKSAEEILDSGIFSGGRVAGTGGSTNDAYIQALEDITGKKIQAVQNSAELTTKRQESIAADITTVSDLRTANANIVGEVQGVQVGNEISSEILAQLIKMRQENASADAIAAKQQALEIEAEELEKARRTEMFQRSNTAIQSAIQEANESPY